MLTKIEQEIISIIKNYFFFCFCKNSWITEEWSACTNKCGVGVQRRNVYCQVEGKNEMKMMVDDGQCMSKKPAVERDCNTEDCPQWFEGPWSEVSEKEKKTQCAYFVLSLLKFMKN